MRTFEMIFVTAVLALFPAWLTYAQEPFQEPVDVQDTLSCEPELQIDSLTGEILVPEGYELVDTLVYVPVERIDTALAGKDIFSLLPLREKGGAADVHVYQSSAIVSAMKKSRETNFTRPYTGYRVRIFFDNRQSARQDSEEMMKTFESMYPGVPAYRSYVNPYFKITVGDFRTKSEAMSFLQDIIGVFPKAFIVKEHIEYPVVDRDSLVRVDTVKILRRLTETETVAL